MFWELRKGIDWRSVRAADVAVCDAELFIGRGGGSTQQSKLDSSRRFKSRPKLLSGQKAEPRVFCRADLTVGGIQHVELQFPVLLEDVPQD